MSNSKFRITNAIWASVVAALLGGCVVGPNYVKPEARVPGQWPVVATTLPSTRPVTQPLAAPVELAQWWAQFKDPVLDGLVKRAIESNLDLKQAELRIREARLERVISGTGLWPSVNASGDASRARNGGSTRNLFRAGVDAAWELDFFGGTQRSIEAAEASIQSAQEDQRDLMVTLISEVALNYIELRGLQKELDVAQRNLELQKKSADLVQRRFKGGFTNALDVANADAQVATTTAAIPSLESQIRQTIQSIGVLLGVEPQALVDELSESGTDAPSPPEVPIGLPSDLLLRRPDIRRAEAQIHVATARVGVATADLYPRFSLTGALGLSNSSAKSLVNWSSRFWSMGAAVDWSVFDAGRIRANIQVQNALEQQAVLAYQQTILIALRDVENSLVAYVKEQERRAALQDAVTANRKAVDLSQRLYSQGQVDFLNVLNAQRSLLGAEDALARSEQAVSANLVSVYKTLGGGWDESGK